MGQRIIRAVCRRALAITLAMWLVPFSPFGLAQEGPQKLNIVIVEGEGAINNIRQRTAREPIVQVEDENHKPIAGATVVFLLPNSGPGGTFPDGAQSLTVTTDSNGQAVAHGFRANNVSGKFEIRVEASYQDLFAQAAIGQANAVLTSAAAAGTAGGISGKLVLILAAIGGAAAAGVIAATSGGNSATPGTNPPPTPTPTPTTINPGTPSVGGP